MEQKSLTCNISLTEQANNVVADARKKYYLDMPVETIRLILCNTHPDFVFVIARNKIEFVSKNARILYVYYFHGRVTKAALVMRYDDSKNTFAYYVDNNESAEYPTIDEAVENIIPGKKYTIANRAGSKELFHLIMFHERFFKRISANAENAETEETEKYRNYLVKNGLVAHPCEKDGEKTNGTANQINAINSSPEIYYWKEFIENGKQILYLPFDKHEMKITLSEIDNTEAEELAKTESISLFLNDNIACCLFLGNK